MGTFSEENINNPAFTVDNEEIVNPTVPNWMADIPSLTYNIDGLPTALPLRMTEGGTYDGALGLALNFLGTTLNLGYAHSDISLTFKAGSHIAFENNGYTKFDQGFWLLPSDLGVASGYNFFLKDFITGYILRFYEQDNRLVPKHQNELKTHIETNGYETDIFMWKIDSDYPKFNINKKTSLAEYNSFFELIQTDTGASLKVFEEDSSDAGVLNFGDTQLQFDNGYIQGLQIGVDIDAAGTDNSTDVTINVGGADYLTLNGQVINQSLIDETSSTHFANPITYGMSPGNVLKSESSAGPIASDEILMSTGTGVKEASNTAINKINKQAKAFAMIF